uniref:GRIP domain-containing protein n=1 Tax=Ciona intestinalis TaxID=7719 RepID=F6PH58_CIOIN
LELVGSQPHLSPTLPGRYNNNNLDTMSHEDLVKGYKRQMLLLQKLKAKCDEFQTKNESLKSTEALLKKGNNAMNEELECLTSNKELAEQSEKSQIALKDVQAEKIELADQIQDQLHQISDLKSHIKNLSSEHAKLEELTGENKTLKKELAAMKMTVNMFKTQKKPDQTEKIEELNLKVEELNEEVKLLETQSVKLNEDREAERSNHKQMCVDLETELHASVKHQSEVESELESSKTEVTDLKEKLIQLQEIHTAKNIKSTKADLEEKLLKLETENSDLNSTITTLQAEQENRKESDTEKADLLKELSEANKQLTIQTDAISRLTSENEEIKSSAKDLLEQKDLASLDLEKERERVKCLTESENKLFQKMTQKESEIQILEEKFKDLQTKAHEFEQRSKDVENISSQNNQLGEKLAEAKNKKQLSAEVMDLKEQLSNSTCESETVLKKYTEENVTLQNAISQLESDKEEINANKESLQADLEDVKQELSVLRTENESFKASIESNNGAVHQLAEQVEKNDSMMAQITDLNTEVEAASKEIEVLKEKLKNQDELVNEKEVLAEKCSQYSNNCRELQEKVEVLEKELKEYVDQVLTKVADTNQAAEEKVRELELENSELHKQVEDHKEDNLSIKEKMSQLQGKLQKSDSQCGAMGEEISSLKEENEKLVAGKSSASNSVAELQKELNEYKSQMKKLEDSDAVILQQKEDNLSIKEEMSQLQGKLQLQKELNEYKSQMEEQATAHSAEIQELNCQIETLTRGASLTQDEKTEMDQLKRVAEEKNKVGELKSNLETEELKQNKFQEQILALEEKLKTTTDAKDEALSEIKRLTSSHQESKEMATALQQEKEKLNNHLLDVKNEIQMLERKDKLSETEEIVSAQESSADLTEAESKCKDLELKVETLTLECERLTQSQSELDVSVGDGEGGGNQKEIVSFIKILFCLKENLQQSVHEKEILNNKLKILAVKAKKERDAAKMQLQVAQEETAALKVQISGMEAKLMGSQTQASNVQMMQLECDKLQDEVDQINKEKSSIQKSLDETLNQLTASQVEKAKLSEQLDSTNSDVLALQNSKAEVEQLLNETKTLVTLIEKEKENVSKEKKLFQELEATKIQISTLSKSVDDYARKLKESQTALKDAEMVIKNVKQHGLMSLEMEQYEKTVEGLQSNITELSSKNQELKSEIIGLEEKITSLQEERKEGEKLRIEAEDRVTKTKETLDVTRDELSNSKALEKELNIQVSEGTSQICLLTEETEQQKLDLASQSSENRVLQEQIVALKTSTTRNIETLERRLHSAQMEVESLKSEKETLKHDYESYKVRVHSVLKQQKSKDTQPPAKQDTTEINNLKLTMEQIKMKLHESQNILASREGELDLLQGDYDRLLRQQQESSDSAVEREGRWKSRVKSLQQELASVRKQYADALQNISDREDSVSAASQLEMQRMKEDHEKVVSLIKEDVAHLERELQKARSDAKRNPLPYHYHRPPLESHPSMMSSVDYRSVAREDGEGEENPDRSSVVSFEQILKTPNQIKSVTVLSDTVSLSSEVQLKQLESRFEAQSKQLEHLSEVASENEATTARLIDQNQVLKDEIRRLEKNQERQASVSNLEYLKNVIYKFATLPPCDEKQHLLPVLDTMLKLTAEEKLTLQTIALGDNTVTESQEASGWGSYLQRWSGMQ